MKNYSLAACATPRRRETVSTRYLLTASGDRSELLRRQRQSRDRDPCQSNDRAERGRSPEGKRSRTVHALKLASQVPWHRKNAWLKSRPVAQRTDTSPITGSQVRILLRARARVAQWQSTISVFASFPGVLNFRPHHLGLVPDGSTLTSSPVATTTDTSGRALPEMAEVAGSNPARESYAFTG